MSVKKAARAKKTNARGEASPDAELGALVDEAAPVEDVVFEPVELDPVELLFEADVLVLFFDAEEPVEVVEEPLEVVETPMSFAVWK